MGLVVFYLYTFIFHKNNYLLFCRILWVQNFCPIKCLGISNSMKSHGVVLFSDIFGFLDIFGFSFWNALRILKPPQSSGVILRTPQTPLGSTSSFTLPLKGPTGDS